MEKRIKFIVIGLAGILLISLLINLQTYGSRHAILKEKDDLQKENAALNRKVNSLESSLRDNENRIASLNMQLDKASQEKEEIQRKFELASKERDALAGKLKARPEMETMPAGISPSEDAYWGKILKAKIELEMQLENIRGELKTAQINNEQLQREKSTSQLEVTNLTREQQDLKRQFEYNQKIMDSLAQELVREKNDKLQINDSVKSIKNENAVLRRQLKSLDNRKIILERKLAELQKENGALAAKLTDMETLFKERAVDLDNLKKKLESAGSASAMPESEKESVELPPIVVRPQVETFAPSEPAAFSGANIVAVNKEGNFVIIDLGEEAGVKTGDVFQVYREDKVIGSIEVMQTRKNIAACDIKKEASPIKVGDTIR